MAIAFRKIQSPSQNGDLRSTPEATPRRCRVLPTGLSCTRMETAPGSIRSSSPWRSRGRRCIRPGSQPFPRAKGPLCSCARGKPPVPRSTLRRARRAPPVLDSVDQGGVLRIWQGMPFYEEYPSPISQHSCSTASWSHWLASETMQRPPATNRPGAWERRRANRGHAVAAVQPGRHAEHVCTGLSCRRPRATPVEGATHRIAREPPARFDALTGRPIYHTTADRWARGVPPPIGIVSCASSWCVVPSGHRVVGPRGSTMEASWASGSCRERRHMRAVPALEAIPRQRPNPPESSQLQCLRR